MEAKNPTITTIDLTPRARSMIRHGLALVREQYEKIEKAADKLEEVATLEASKEARRYVESVGMEFAEPGSPAAEARDQSDLFGDEGPFRKDLYDLKGRPDGTAKDSGK